MKTPKINYFLVGAFVLVCLGGLLTMVALMSGRSGPMEGYYSTYGNVAGLKDGAQVLYEGYPIGEVTDIIPQPVDGGMTFRVDYGVQEGWQIPQDSIARIASNGLLSAITINIEAGSSPVALAAGDEVPASQTGDLFAVVADVATTLSDVADSGVRPLLDRLLHYVDSIGQPLEQNAPEMMAELRQLVSDLRKPVLQVEESIPVITGNLEDFTAQLKSTGGKVEAAVSEDNVRQLEQILSNINQLSRDLNATRGNLDQVMTSAERLINNTDGLIDNTNQVITTTGSVIEDAGRVVTDNRGNIDSSMEDLQAIMRTTSRNVDTITRNLDITSRNLKEFSRQIRENPGLLLGGSAQPQ